MEPGLEKGPDNKTFHFRIKLIICIIVIFIYLYYQPILINYNPIGWIG